MENYLHFIANHWFLSSAFVFVLVLILILEYKSRAQGPRRLSAQGLVALMNHKDAVVIDIRDKSVYARGHIIGAISMTSDQFNASNQSLMSHRDKSVVVVCNKGIQALKAGQVLQSLGFTQVFVLTGGMTSWQDEHMPLIKSTKRMG